MNLVESALANISTSFVFPMSNVDSKKELDRILFIGIHSNST
jgi:hypothetical protein